MAKANNEFKEIISKERCFSVLKTRVSDKYLLLIKVVTPSNNIEDKIKLLGVTSGKDVSVEADVATLRLLKSKVRELIPLVIPKASKKEILFSEVSSLDPSAYIIEGDINKELYEKGYKYLIQDEVEAILDAKSIDHTIYTYTTIVIKNEYDLDKIRKPLTRGYENYDDAIVSRMINSSQAAVLEGTHDKKIIKAFDRGKHVIAVSEPGVGKSTDAEIVASKIEVPLVNALAHKDFTNGDILGEQGADSTGKIAFIDANGAYALKYGGIYLIDEATSSPCIASTLNVLADDTPVIQLPNGELVKKHKDFRLMLCYNPGANETFLLPESTSSRFKTIYYKQLTEEQFVTRIQCKCGGFSNTKFLKELYKVFINSSKYCASCNYSISINIRYFIDFLNEILEDDTVGKDEWYEYFSSIFSHVLYAREQIDASQIPDLDKVAEPWVDKLYEIYHEADIVDEETSSGGFTIDTAVVEEVEAVDDYLNSSLGFGA